MRGGEIGLNMHAGRPGNPCRPAPKAIRAGGKTTPEARPGRC
jgi:hypothetical protein